MPAVIVVGAQWGDEGKGKIVDLLSPYSNLVVRYAGGANAGHTLVVKGDKVVLHLVPSGILHQDKQCLIGSGTVVDPLTLLEEIRELETRGMSLKNRLFLAQRAHVVLPHHKVIDELREKASGGVIGTTKRGIGPTYEDKIGRRGIRIGDLLRSKLKDKLKRNIDGWAPYIKSVGGSLPDLGELHEQLMLWGQQLEPYITDGIIMVSQALEEDQKILLEGAQGTMLDVDHGTYPFVTSSNASAGGACTGAGIGPSQIDTVIGITKAYATRVGGGPFPTELIGEAGEVLRRSGAEFGATTGRPRRCGWLDIPALRAAVRINGLTSVALTKLDVLSGIKELKVCVGYRYEGANHEHPPFDALDDVAPIYESLEGWTEEIVNCRALEELPSAAKHYIQRISELIGCPITLLSVGPDREQTLGLKDPFIESLTKRKLTFESSIREVGQS